jgi:thiamine-phosphate pyrophosphorylase
MSSLNPKLPGSPFLYPIIDSSFSADIVTDAAEVIRAGAEILQIRAKTSTRRELFEMVTRLSDLQTKNQVRLIVNDAVDVVLVSDAAGVHLGQEDFPAEPCRELLPSKIIGLSTHSLEEWRIAETLPVDYIAVGPVFASSTKPEAGSGLGMEFVRNICKKKTKPVVCIGGIHRTRFQQVIDCGVDGIAIISELYSQPDLYESMSRLLEAMRKS